MDHEYEENAPEYTFEPDWREEGEGLIPRPTSAPDNMEATEKGIEAVQSS